MDLKFGTMCPKTGKTIYKHVCEKCEFGRKGSKWWLVDCEYVDLHPSKAPSCAVEIYNDKILKDTPFEKIHDTIQNKEWLAKKWMEHDKVLADLESELSKEITERDFSRVNILRTQLYTIRHNIYEYCKSLKTLRRIELIAIRKALDL